MPNQFSQQLLALRTAQLKAKTDAIAAAAKRDAVGEQVSLGETIIKEAMAAAEKARKETQQRAEKAKAAQGQAQERDPGLGESANPEPILQPPTTLQPTRPEAGPTLSPAPVTNYGEPGGPQPGSPGQQGGAAPYQIAPARAGGQQATYQAPPTDPYLMSTTVREGREELMPGVLIPSRQRQTTIAPNTLTAYNAGRLGMAAAQAANVSRDTYFDSVAEIIHKAEVSGDPALRALGNQHIVAINRDMGPEGLRTLDDRIGLVSSKWTAAGLSSPREMPDGRGGTVFMPGNAVVGLAGNKLDVARQTGALGLSRLSGALAGIGQVLREPIINKAQQDIVDASDAMSRLVTIRRAYDPNRMTVGSAITNWGAAALERLDPGILSPETKDELAKFTELRSNIAENMRKLTTVDAGKTLTPTELQSMKPFVIQADDSPSQLEAKWGTAMRSQAYLIARRAHMLQNGVVSEASAGAWLRATPGLQFNFHAGGLSEGESNMLRIMAEREQALRYELRQQLQAQGAKKIDDAQVNRAAESQMYMEFGLTPEAAQYLTPGASQ